MLDMFGAVTLWFCLLTGPPAFDKLGQRVREGLCPAANWIARNAPEWLQDKMITSAGRMSIYGWAVEEFDRKSFDGVLNVILNRNNDTPLRYPIDPYGPR